MVAGKTLTLRADRGQVITRVLVSVENGVYFVCKPEEFEAADREQRKPICIGFRPEYVLK